MGNAATSKKGDSAENGIDSLDLDIFFLDDITRNCQNVCV